MKKYLLSAIALGTLSMSAFAQPSCKVISPASIAGNKTFTWADNWGQTPDHNVPGSFVQDTVMFVEDGTAGTNPQGNPVSQEGCSPLTNDLTGKIALVYRNTCEFGTKALNAENAGAEAVIIINRDPEAIGMGAGADGPNVTIPVYMITSDDGIAIKAEMQNGPVVVFLGNKQGLNPNDIATNNGVAQIANYATGNLAFNNEFTPTIEIYNVGSADQSAVSVNAVITGPSGIVYDETVGPFAMTAGDTNYIATGNPNSFPLFTQDPFVAGDYSLTYTITLGANTDDDPSDNTITSDFSLNDTWLSMSPTEANGDPITNSYPSNSEGVYTHCMKFREDNPNSDMHITSVKYVPDADTTGQLVDISGEEVVFKIYRWEDSSQVEEGVSIFEEFQHAFFLNDNNDVRQVVEDDFLNTDQVSYVYEANQLYLLCLETSVGENLAFGWNNSVDYNGNEAINGLSVSPIQVVQTGAATWFLGGWAGVSAPGMSVKFQGGAGLEEANTVKVGVYPNPATDEVRINSSNNGSAVVTVTDMSGKVVAVNEVNFASGSVSMSTSSLEAGMYIFNVDYNNGEKARVNVIKK